MTDEISTDVVLEKAADEDVDQAEVEEALDRYEKAMQGVPPRKEYTELTRRQREPIDRGLTEVVKAMRARDGIAIGISIEAMLEALAIDPDQMLEWVKTKSNIELVDIAVGLVREVGESARRLAR